MDTVYASSWTATFGIIWRRDRTIVCAGYVCFPGTNTARNRIAGLGVCRSVETPAIRFVARVVCQQLSESSEGASQISVVPILVCESN